tara:strand:+ start:24 stop:215 length:192 start_codon:yes stop_codon:yes gene_type:complete
MSELNIHGVTEVKITRRVRPTYTVMCVITSSTDYRGIVSTDTQSFYSKGKKLKVVTAKIEKTE